MNRHLGRILLATALLVLPVTTAFGGVLEDRLSETREQAQHAKSEMHVVDRRQQAIVRQVSRLNARINALEVPLRQLEADVAGLEYQIERRQQRIVELRVERARQAKEIARLGDELDAARDLLALRVVTAYKTGDVGMIEELAGAGSLEELFRRQEALSQVVGLDDDVIERIGSAERSMRVKRARNVAIREQIRRDIEGLEKDRVQVDAKRAQAQQRRDAVYAAKVERDQVLRKLNARKQALTAQLDDLEDNAKVLKDIIENGSTTYTGAIGGLSSSGFIWPVSGPVVSPFGQRWGRMHQGIDIAVGAGTPIIAAASGIVTYAGWMSGYGNMVIVQHANGLGTGYAHQSRIGVSNGQVVNQGQVIGYVGCTGHCFGDHLHFEVYVNGVHNDPMQYLS